MTRPLHPKPKVQIEGQSTRVRRTKAEISLARQRAEIEAIWAEGQRIANERLARTSPAEDTQGDCAFAQVVRVAQGRAKEAANKGG